MEPCSCGVLPDAAQTGWDGDPADVRTSGLHSAHFSADSALCLANPPRTFKAPSAISDLRSRRCIVLESSPTIFLLFLFALIKKCRSFGKIQDQSCLSKLLESPSWVEPEDPGLIPTMVPVIMRSASCDPSVNVLVPVKLGSVAMLEGESGPHAAQPLNAVD